MQELSYEELKLLNKLSEKLLNSLKWHLLVAGLYMTEKEENLLRSAIAKINDSEIKEVS